MANILVHAGFGNYVAGDRVRWVRSPTSASVQRLIREGKQGQHTIDLTSGRRTKLVLSMDTGRLFLLGINEKTWAKRLGQARAIAAAGD